MEKIQDRFHSLQLRWGIRSPSLHKPWRTPESVLSSAFIIAAGKILAIRSVKPAWIRPWVIPDAGDTALNGGRARLRQGCKVEIQSAQQAMTALQIDRSSSTRPVERQPAAAEELGRPQQAKQLHHWRGFRHGPVLQTPSKSLKSLQGQGGRWDFESAGF
jgi:hypothetical protein